jgi:hypothetical protein
MSSEIVSLREFARRTNIGEKTIRDGIKKGKISKGVIYENNKPKIDYDIAINEIKETGLGRRILVSKELQFNEKPFINATEESNKSQPIKPNAYQEALEKKERYNAKLKELEFKEKEKTLVLKTEVYSQLFEFGKEIRTEFESLPGRILSKIIICNNDITKISELLNIEIRASLSRTIDNLSEKEIC